MGAPDQLGAQRHGYITRFHILNNFVFRKTLRIVVQLHLVVKVEGSLRIIIEVQIQFFPDFTGRAHIDIHIKIEVAIALLAQGQDRILNFLVIKSEGQVDVALRFDVHFRATKQAIDQRIFDIEFGNRINNAAAAFFVGRYDPLQAVKIFILLLPIAPAHILVKSHVRWCTVEIIADFFGNDIHICLRVVFHRLFDGFRIS